MDKFARNEGSLNRLQQMKSAYGSTGQGKSGTVGLRRKAPGYRGASQEKKEPSPGRGDPRAGDNYSQPIDFYGQRPRGQEDEEEAYERRRQENLRKQIAVKERQLAEMAQQSEALKQRIGQPQLNQDLQTSGKYGAASTGTSNRYINHKVAPLRNPVASKSPALGGGIRSQQHAGTTQEARLPQRDLNQRTSPLRGNQTMQADDRSRSRSKSPIDLPVSDSNFGGTRDYRAITSPDNQRRTSPLRQKTRSRSPPRQTYDDAGAFDMPERDSIIRPQPVTQASAASGDRYQSLISKKDQFEARQRDRIETLQIDNASLQRRLALVEQELDRVNSEKARIDDRLVQQKEDNSQLEKGLSVGDSVDQTNAAYEDDLVRRRSDNKRTQNEIDESKMQIKLNDDKLLRLSADQKHLYLQKQDLDNELDRKVSRIDQNDQQRLDVSKKLIGLTADIEQSSQEEHSIHKANLDLETHIRGLQNERINLLKDLEKLTISNDDFVREVGQQRKNVDHQNDWQTKLIVTKIMVHFLNVCTHNRREDALNEMRLYSKFDSQCQKKLKAFSLILLKLGQYYKGNALRRWYDNALKPIDTHYQNYEIAAKIANDRIKQAVFATWKKDVRARMNVYEQKTNAINKVWEKLCQSANADAKRALLIWKEKNRFDNMKVKKFRKILTKRMHSIMAQGINRWKNFSMEINQACRTILLRDEYTQKIFLNQLFQSFKQAVREQKHMRIITQGKVFKAWQDHLCYQKHLVLVNMTSLHLARARNKATMKACNDALRNYKEAKKFGIMDYALNQDMIPALEATASANKAKKESIQARSLKNRTNTIKNMFGRQLYEYFSHWRTLTVEMKQYAGTKVKDRIYQMYRGTLKNYFTLWAKNDVKKTVRKKKKMMMQMEMESKGMENEAIAGAQKEKKAKDMVRSVQQKKGTKQLNKLMARVYRNAFDRWKDHQNEREAIKTHQNKVMTKLKKRYQNDAFARLKEFSAFKKQNSRNLASAEYLQNTVNKRIMRKMLDRYQAFLSNYRKATKALGKVDKRIDRWWLRLMFRDFVKRLDLKKKGELGKKKRGRIAMNEEMNAEIGQQEKAFRENEKKNDQAVRSMKKKGQRLIGNYFARYYADNTAGRFKKWKQWANLERQREKVMKRTLNHWMKKIFELVTNGMRAHGEEQKKREKDHKIKRAMIMQDEQQQSIVNNDEVMTQKREKVAKDKVRSVKKQNKRKGQIAKSIGIMTDKNHNLEWVSRKRQIFMAWRFCVKQQVAFLQCVKDVLQKSMWAHGFQAINDASRGEKDKRNLTKLMKKYIKAISGNRYGASLNRWKFATFGIVDQTFKTTNDAYEETNSKFRDKITRVKAQNMKNGEEYFHKKHLKKFFQAWRKQGNSFKLNRIKTGESQEQNRAIQHKRYLQKWALRAELTKKLRYNLRKCKENKATRIKIMVWKGLRSRRAITTHLVKSISNLERLFRERNHADGFKNIKSFSVSKKTTIARNRLKSAKDCESMLTKYYFERMARYFGKWRGINKDKDFKAQHCRKIINKIANFNLRCAFIRWHKITDQIVFAEEMNQTGPITEQVFEATRLGHNLKEFMRSENFTEEEIAAKDAKVKEYNKYLMDKALRRFKISKADKKIVGALEHWKKWIATKRLFNYYVKEGNNQTMFGKCDLNWAFKKWLNADAQMVEYLGRQNQKDLKNSNIVQAKMLDRLANREAEDCAILNHLNLQRDELLDAYIKAQRHALGLFRDNHRHTREKAFNRWKNWLKFENFGNAKAQIQQAVEEITAIKGRVAELEKTNGVLAKENDELRQFSMDGFQIAKNVQQLSNERETLSVDLADKTDHIRQLLEDNRKLKLKLLNLGIDDEDPVGQGPRLAGQTQIRSKNKGQFPQSPSIRGSRGGR